MVQVLSLMFAPDCLPAYIKVFIFLAFSSPTSVICLAERLSVIVQ